MIICLIFLELLKIISDCYEQLLKQKYLNRLYLCTLLWSIIKTTF